MLDVSVVVGGAEIATAAEQAGFDSLWTVEHVVVPSAPDEVGASPPQQLVGAALPVDLVFVPPALDDVVPVLGVDEVGGRGADDVIIAGSPDDVGPGQGRDGSRRCAR